MDRRLLIASGLAALGAVAAEGAARAQDSGRADPDSAGAEHMPPPGGRGPD